MKRSKRVIVLLAGTVMLGLVAEAGVAADFTPTIEFTLGDNKALANPELRAVVKQDEGEEELASVELKVPPGFTLAVDQQLQDGEELGSGEIVIHAGPRCRGAPAGSAPLTVPVSIIERNRKASEIADKVVAVYVVDLRPVATIDLLVKGDPDKGYTLFGNVPANADTCPPFTFDARFRKKAETSGTTIFTNPQFGGDYKFEATFISTATPPSKSNSEQIVKIDGPSKAGAAVGATEDGKKKCKKIKNKKKRKKCLKKL